MHKLYIRSLQKMYLKQKLNKSLINLNCQERAKTGFKWPRGRKLPTTRGAAWKGEGWFSGLRGCVLVLPFFDSICPSLHLSISPFVCLFMCLCISSICRSLYYSISLSISLYLSLSFSLSVSLSLPLSRCEGCVINKS